MPLTHDFKETVKARADSDPKYRHALISEAIQCLLIGDVETGKILLRDFINARIGFATLAAATRHSAKSLMRMFGPQGNPQANNLFAVIDYLQKKEGIKLEVRAGQAAPKRRLAQAATASRAR